MRYLNYILQFLFIRVAKFEFLNSDGKIEMKVLLQDEGEKYNALHVCYGFIGFVPPFINRKEWFYFGSKWSLPFITNKTLERIGGSVKEKEVGCVDCLFFISKHGSCGKGSMKSLSHSFPNKSKQDCFENIN